MTTDTTTKTGDEVVKHTVTALVVDDDDDDGSKEGKKENNDTTNNDYDEELIGERISVKMKNLIPVPSSAQFYPNRISRQDVIAEHFSNLRLTTNMLYANEDVKFRTFRIDPRIRCLLDALGWILMFFLALMSFIIGNLVSPIMFSGLKMRYIWSDITWERLVAYELQPENALFHLRFFPYPILFQHAGPLPANVPQQSWVVLLKMLYAIPQGIIFGPIVASWLMFKLYTEQSAQVHAIRGTELHVVVRLILFLGETPFGTAVRRTWHEALFLFDVSTDIIVMYKLYHTERIYWFALVCGSIFAAILVPWSRSITYVKEYFVKRQDQRWCWFRVLRTMAVLYLIPWCGIVIMLGLDVYLAIQTILDWPRLLFFGKVRDQTEEEESYLRLRSLTELLCESIPQLVIQWFILSKVSDSANLGITKQDLIRSIFASALNLTFELVILYIESLKFKVTFQGSQMYEKLTLPHYMFITMEGRFGFSTKLLSIQGGATTVDLSQIEFRSDPFMISNFVQATQWSNGHERTLERVIISTNTVAGLTDANLKVFGDHCNQQHIRIVISVPWKQWIRFQLAQDYALFVCDDLKTGETALTYAVYMDNYDGKEWCERLLSAGADVNMKNRASETPIYLATFLKKPEYVKLFLDHGANVKDKIHFNRENKTPLFPACDSKMVSVISMLLDHGVDVFAQDLEFGNTALKNSGWLDNAVCETILTHETTRRQEKEKGMRLVNVANLKGDTILFPAVNFGVVDVVELLIKAGANVNHVNKDGKSVLFKVTKKPILEMLVDSGANLELTDQDGETPIFTGVRKNLYLLIELFEELGANINHQNDNGDTIFSLIAKNEEYELLGKFVHLFEKRIDLTLTNKENKTVYDIIQEASQKGDSTATAILPSIRQVFQHQLVNKPNKPEANKDMGITLMGFGEK